jgi:hypothetical protein
MIPNAWGKGMEKKLIRSDEGMILVVCMMLLVILSLMGVAAIMTTSTETKITANFRKSEQAFFAADSGVEDARFRISMADNPGATFTGPTEVNYRITVLDRIPTTGLRGDGTVIYSVESRGWDPANRSQRIIRADIQITQTGGRADDGSYMGGY